LGVVWFSQGKYIEAKQTWEKALQLTMKLLREKDPQKLAIMDKLARVHSALQRYDEAQEIYRQIIDLGISNRAADAIVFRGADCLAGPESVHRER
jgi:tetratricopeptide (TPR) repeat protein